MLTQELPDMLDGAAAMLRNLARMLNAEFDDLYQEAAVLALEIAPKLNTISNPRPYFLRAVRYHLLSLYTPGKHPSPLSLDMPMFDDGEATLADTLAAAPTMVENFPPSSEEREQVLYSALREMPLEEQSYIRHAFKLNAFEPAPASWPCSPPRYGRTTTSMRRSAFRRLRKNVQLSKHYEVMA